MSVPEKPEVGQVWRCKTKGTTATAIITATYISAGGVSYDIGGGYNDDWPPTVIHKDTQQKYPMEYVGFIQIQRDWKHTDPPGVTYPGHHDGGKS